jgi:signal transduction histidine kinase
MTGVPGITGGLSSSARHTPEPGGDLRHIRLLVIDDDSDTHALIASALVDAPFERTIDVVPNVTNGLARIRADEHDVYIVDHRLPDGTGIGLIHEAKTAGIDKPFILITGYGSGALDEAALHEGAADYVEKHLLSTHLERAIRYALRDWHNGRALREREEQLRHAQKMEGIGRLAGGVAHDFNNLLTAIIGFTDLILERVEPLDATANDVREIRKAADRAATLTRQLLAFSRRQFLEPRVLDLNETVTGLIRLLPRLVGEHIETSTRLAPHLRHVWADPSQMDQMLLNLVLNARDAMPGRGRLTIETENVELDEERLRTEGSNVKPGRYVMLAIIDTGVGMDAPTRARAFEPFFTTKPPGKGTGLGLSTVYGIVEQSGGMVTLDSAPGHGTTVRVYLPIAVAASDPHQAAVRASAVGTGSETLLLVDDDDLVRHVTAEALRRRGYTVHEAANPEDALRWVQAGRRPQLLLTDVVMPHMSGPELAARLLPDNPGMRVLYISGYTSDALAVHGGSLRGVPLLQKPFTLAQLTERVRAVLEAPAGAP